MKTLKLSFELRFVIFIQYSVFSSMEKPDKNCKIKERKTKIFNPKVVYDIP